MHARQKAHANRPPNGLGNFPLIDVSQAGISLLFDSPH